MTGLQPEDFDALDDILDDLRTRYEETPQWEFCEGFLVALICCRRDIPEAEWLPVLLGLDDDGAGFSDEAQKVKFLSLWQQRYDEVKKALDTEIKALDEDSAYAPEVMDVRGAIASLPPEERAEIDSEEIPAFAQVWALGFMFAVENWPEEWAAPRDKEAAKWLDASLESMVALTEDDTGAIEVSPFSDDSPPSMSQARVDAFADAVWAVHDLFELWRGIGPRVETVRKVAGPGRNDACPCGSGKKFKKCCGAEGRLH